MTVARRHTFEPGTPGSSGAAAPAADQRARFGGADALPLRCHDLFHDMAALAPLLSRLVRHGAWLDAYLIAAGLSQIVEDYLHPDPLMLGKVADVLGDLGGPIGARMAGLVRGVRAAAVRLTTVRPTHRRVEAWHARLATLLDSLADAVVRNGEVGPAACVPMSGIVSRCDALVAEAGSFPTDLLRTVCHLPSCFRSFDQQPTDLARIVDRLAQRWPDRRRPLVVVGVRTSGSFLAPLYGAYLRAAGYEHVATLTVRPGRALSLREQRLLGRARADNGLVLLTDDPPQSGRSIARAADDLVRLGVPQASIVLLLQLFGAADTLPPALRPYEAVLLPWDEWSIQARLEPAAVRAALERLTGPDVSVGRVERVPLPAPSSPRSHVRALYRVQVEQAGQARDETVLVRGTGLGYFGRQTLAVSDAVGDFLPPACGFEDGLLYRAWVPEAGSAGTAGEPVPNGLAEAAVAYVVARRQALAVPEDVSRRMLGEWPAWEVASTALSHAFGRAWIAARMPLVDPIVRHLLRVAHPAVIDANMALTCWLPSHDGSRPFVKVGFDEGIFRGDVELACYDPVFDLASLVANVDYVDGTADRATVLARSLRDGYERATGERIDDERWLLYELVRLWDEQRAADVTRQRTHIARARARALQRYISATFFAGVPAPDRGPLCALDVDGVLETSALGFASVTPASALALRALALHGFRTVLATGRSLDEVRERCQVYPLVGGVAEYGSVVYVKATEQVTDLLSDEDRADLGQLRAVLAGLDGVCLDPDFRFAIRAYRADSRGRRRGLSREVAEGAIAEAGGEGKLRAIHGDDQTDFVPVGVDKGRGLRALRAALGQAGPAEAANGQIALAVGDTESDLPMLACARLACAPAHADAALRRAAVSVVGRPYQAGMSQAVGRLLGHAPGRCPTCRPPKRSAKTRLLLDLLAVPESGRCGIAQSVLRLALSSLWLHPSARVTHFIKPTSIGIGG